MPNPTPPSPSVTETFEFTGQSTSGKADAPSEPSVIIVTFNASAQWTASVPQACKDWCSINPSSGTKDVKSAQIRVSNNGEYDERNASITFACGNVRKTFVVTQKQLDAMLLASSSKVEVEEDGGAFAVTLQSNVDVTCRVPDQYASWIHLEGTSGSRGLTDRKYSFAVDANETAAVRRGVVSFTGAGVTEEVQVYQIGGESILLSDDIMYVSYLGGRFGVELRSNCEFSYSISQGGEWLREDASRAMSSHTVYFIADENDTEGDRVGEITFVSAQGGAVEKLAVIQREKSALVCGEKNLDVDCAGGEFDIEYASTDEDISVKCPDWIAMEGHNASSRALDPYKLHIRIQPNLAKEDRQGFIVLETSDCLVKDSVAVTQKALEISVSTSLKEGDFADARSHEFTVEAISPIETKIEVASPISYVSGNKYKISANYARGVSGMSAVEIRLADILAETLSVGYAAPIEPEIIEEEVTADAVEGQAAVKVRCNTDISVAIQGNPQWISLRQAKTAERGTAIDSWIFDLKKNENTQPRSATILLSAGGFWSGQAVITQAAASNSSGEETSVETGQGGGLDAALGQGKMSVEKLVVKGTVNGKDVTTLREMATDGMLVDIDLSETELRKDLENQYYPGSWKPGKITEDDMIGHYMFYQTNIKRVALPQRLKSIGYYAFNSSMIEEIDMPTGLEYIEESAFKDCKKLKKASIPATIERLPTACFEGCVALRDVALPDGLRCIGDFAFAPKEAYTTQGALEEIELPQNLEEIGRGAFMSTKLQEVEIPASVTKIGEMAFSECRYLNKIVFRCRMDTLPKRLLCNSLGINELVLPKGLKVIGEYALDHIGMDYLLLPEGVVELQTGACNGSGKAGLRLPESLEIVGARSLGYQSMCHSFTLPAKVRYIGNRAFDGACYIKELHIKNPVPPEHDGEIFFNTFKYGECTLYVPKGSAKAYGDDEYWKKFKAIVEE